MAGRTLEQTLVKTYPFNGNNCTDKKCIPSQTDSKINCRKNCICYKITCKLSLLDGKSGDISATYFGESGKNMHCRAKEQNSTVRKNTLERNLYLLNTLKTLMGEDLKIDCFQNIFILKYLNLIVKHSLSV